MSSKRVRNVERVRIVIDEAAQQLEGAIDVFCVSQCNGLDAQDCDRLVLRDLASRRSKSSPTALCHSVERNHSSPVGPYNVLEVNDAGSRDR